MRRSAAGRGPAGEWQSARGSLRMKTPISAADQRGLDWFTRWAVLGCSLQVDDTGNLKLIPPPSGCSPDAARQILELRQSIQSDPLLAHAEIGRASCRESVCQYV